jgi:hypothetical protein
MVQNVLLRFGFGESGPVCTQNIAYVWGSVEARRRELLTLAMKNNVVY